MTPTAPLLGTLEQAGVLEPVDVELALALDRIARERAPGTAPRSGHERVLLGAALASRAPRHGHICVDLNAPVALDPESESNPEDGSAQAPSAASAASAAWWPDRDDWLNALRSSPLVREVGSGAGPGTGTEAWPGAVPGAALADADATPLVLQADRLYLDRYWRYEERLAAQVTRRAAQASLEPIDMALLHDGLMALFPDPSAANAPHLPGVLGQRGAAFRAVLRPFLVLSGGPGTGKTSTVVNLLLLLLQQAQARRPDTHPRDLARIALVAPTGKAAARLTEAIRESLEDPDPLPGETMPRGLRPRLAAGQSLGKGIDPRMLDALDLTATTIHRALGIRPDHPGRMRHGPDHPLPADVVVVDEASMIDFVLMTRLLEAVHPDARVLLLGDRNQLASVEAGAVLGDLCDERMMAQGVSRPLADAARNLPVARPPRTDVAHPPAPLADSVVHLSHAFRFSSQGGIRALADAILESGSDQPDKAQAAANQAVSLLTQAQAGTPTPAYPDLEWIALTPGDRAERHAGLRERMVNALGPGLARAVQAVASASDDDRPERIHQALKAMEQFRVLCSHRRGPWGAVALNRLIRTSLADLLPGGDDWFPGCPVMVLENDPRIRLFNGDVGIVLPVPDPHDPDASPPVLRAFFPDEAGRAPRPFARGKLPAHEMCFAMSVHKSQGSQFHEVLLILTPQDSPLLTRELVYTGVTRARSMVRVATTSEGIRAALGRGIRRFSGLREKVWRFDPMPP